MQIAFLGRYDAFFGTYGQFWAYIELLASTYPSLMGFLRVKHEIPSNAQLWNNPVHTITGIGDPSAGGFAIVGNTA